MILYIIKQLLDLNNKIYSYLLLKKNINKNKILKVINQAYNILRKINYIFMTILIKTLINNIN